MLFLDTEFFESRRGPRLLSIGIVAPDGEFYLELDAPSLTKLAGLRKHRFLQSSVLSQFNRVANAQSTPTGMALATAQWLRGLGSETLEVAYDYSMDFHLLEEQLVFAADLNPQRLQAVHVGYLLEDAEGVAAAEASWAPTEAQRELSRHHALAAARALPRRFHAVPS